MGTFLPFFRNHTVLGSADQEPWAYGEPYLTMNRKAIELRYRLLPYLYTATWQCAQTGHPIVRPLVLAYQKDERTHSLEDEFLCGDALLVAPIYKPHATLRTVYLPAGQWYDFWTDEPHAGPATLEVHAPLALIPLFVRAGTVLPMWPVMQHTGERRVDTLILHVYAGNGDSVLYEDDGASMAYQQGEYRITRFAPAEPTVPRTTAWNGSSTGCRKCQSRYWQTGSQSCVSHSMSRAAPFDLRVPTCRASS